MRRLLLGLIVGLLGASSAGCRGDTVVSASDSSSVEDSTADATGDSADAAADAVADSAPDTAAGDSDAGDGGPADAFVSFDAGPADCPSAGNIVVNGTFKSGLLGWAVSDVDATPLLDGGPCGNALHFVTKKMYGNLHQSAKAGYKAGTKYHLRVWTRSDAGAPSRPVAVVANFGHTDDAGVEGVEGVGVDLPTKPGWTLVEDVFTLTVDATVVDVQINSTRTDGIADDVWIAGFSVVPE